MLLAFVNSLNWVPTKLHSFVRNDQNGRTKVLDQTFGYALRHHRGSLVQDRNAQLVQRAPTHHVLQKIILVAIRRLNLKKIHTECSVEAESPWHRCWKPGFWRMSFSCACRALQLPPRVVEDLWPGAAETKSPQEFSSACVSTIA